MVRHRPGVASEKIGVAVERARQIRGGRERKFRLAVFDIDVARENGLAFFHDVYISRAAILSGKDL